MDYWLLSIWYVLIPYIVMLFMLYIYIYIRIILTWKLIVLRILRPSPIEEWEGYDDTKELNFEMVWLDLIGTWAKVQVFGGLREGTRFCISNCSLLYWLGLRPLWDRAWLWSLWAMKLVLENLYLIFFVQCFHLFNY